MKPRSVILVAIVGLALLATGFFAGFFKGIDAASRTWIRMSRVNHIYPGNQAYTAIRLLEDGETERLEWMLENEIDRALEYVERTQQQEVIDPSDPVFKVYDRLKRYRMEHPRHPSPTPTELTEEAVQ
jgi:hypothetical protein